MSHLPVLTRQRKPLVAAQGPPLATGGNEVEPFNTFLAGGNRWSISGSKWKNFEAKNVFIFRPYFVWERKIFKSNGFF